MRMKEREMNVFLPWIDEEIPVSLNKIEAQVKMVWKWED